MTRIICTTFDLLQLLSALEHSWRSHHQILAFMHCRICLVTGHLFMLINAQDGWMQVFTYLILAAGAASAELLYLAYNGDKEVTWSEACGVFGGFCRQARTSVAITFGSVVCYILLSLISSYRLFSAYDAPMPSLGNKGVEIAAFPR
jgi:uncharacterized protein (TIGR01569 family)